MHYFLGTWSGGSPHSHVVVQLDNLSHFGTVLRGCRCVLATPLVSNCAPCRSSTTGGTGFGHRSRYVDKFRSSFSLLRFY